MAFTPKSRAARKAGAQPVQADTPPLGARLRSQRVAMGLSLEDAARRSGVRPEFISALERHDLAALPTVGYGLGYVRAYARVLGLDTE
ncbi:MAG: helix-turn-helix transcriptional regulator, partial [Litorimonas sp.]